MTNLLPIDRRGRKTGQEPTMVPSLLDWAWAIGIYEGEGFCYVSKKSPAAGIGQKDEWLISRLRGFFGGGVYTRPKIHQFPYSEWRICANKATSFLLTIYIHLSPRRKQQIRDVLRNRWHGLITVEP